MKTVVLGKSGITSPQNAFGALPIQRVSDDYAVMLLRRAFDGCAELFPLVATCKNATVSKVNGNNFCICMVIFFPLFCIKGRIFKILC